MRNVQLLILLIILIIAASFFQKSLLSKNKTQTKDKISTSLSTPSPTLSPTLTPAPRAIIKKPFSTQPSNQNVSSDLNSYKYPNSYIESSSNNSLVLSSSDDPAVITSWYKDKLKNQGMNVNSFVQTNSNGNVLNKLASSNGSIKVYVEISKKSSGGSTKIKVNI